MDPACAGLLHSDGRAHVVGVVVDSGADGPLAGAPEGPQGPRPAAALPNARDGGFL